jgi:phosphatidylglycerol:prolipoprotein diacylglycerol transferase
MFPILQIGSLALRLPGLILLVGVWIGISMLDREAKRHELPASLLNNMVFFSLLIGIVGARLGYALRFLNIYLSEPLDLLSLNPNTLAPFDGLVAALLVAFVYGQRKRLALIPTLDALTPGLALIAVFVSVAHLSSGDAFGAPTSVPWAIELWGAKRHPAQVYEIILSLLILVAIQRLKLRHAYSGFIFLVWVALTAASRLFLEAFRGDSVILLGGVRSAQVLSLAILLAAMLGLHLMARRAQAKANR